MTVETILAPDIKIELFGEERKIDFRLKNFAVLKRTFNISEDELLKGLINGDTAMLPYAIWCGTLKFAPFDPAEPLKIESQVELKNLFELNLTQLKEIADKIVLAVEAYLPKKPQDHKKTAKKKTVTKKTSKKKTTTK